MENATIKLTSYTNGGGCGCKIPPAQLTELLTGITKESSGKLLVGNSSADDAAVYELDNDLCLISTTDFFTPIVDDPFDFGRIAAANAISDVYAMGGKPLLALSIIAWPTQLPISIASKVISGANEICTQAGISIVGGHSIENPEPIFGLSVNGTVSKTKIKKNNTAHENDLIFMTKAIGTGILSAALKRNLLSPLDEKSMVESMCQLNKIGQELGEIDEVTAMTDITGFGLLGHLTEMTDKKRLSATIYNSKIPLLSGVKELAEQWIYPDNTMRNWKMYGEEVEGIEGISLLTLCDPQTNGGLLFSVHPSYRDTLLKFFEVQQLSLYEIGFFQTPQEFTLMIQ
jgi:selenide,water dikinase